MTAPKIWLVHNANIGDAEELSDRQMWDLYRAEFSWQELAPWEQQDARTQHAFLAFLKSTSDPEDDANTELQEKYRRVALHENMNLLHLLTECRLDDAKLLALAVIERVHAIATEDAEVRPATIADMKTMGEMAELLHQNRKEPD